MRNQLMNNLALFLLVAALILGSERIEGFQGLPCKRSQFPNALFTTSPSKGPILSRSINEIRRQDKQISWTPRTASPSRARKNIGVSFDTPRFDSQSILSVFSAVTKELWNKTNQLWWTFPLLLAVMPIYTAVTQGSFVRMPEFWPVVSIQGIFPSMFGWVVTGFLSSNICYFLSGAFLWKNLNTGKFRLLGAWLSISGLISTVYHSVQAFMGANNPVTESLAYIDHGVALSAACFYLDTCGWPSKRAWAVGLVGLLCLGVCHTAESYAVLHSIWHVLSAGAATLWSLDGYSRLEQRPNVKSRRIMTVPHASS
eukprot:scaffold5380_cov131-Cylindrotheca_fusiformis.AAC.27